MQRLLLNQPVDLKIYAREKYSGEKIEVMGGQQYLITCDPGERWWDLCIRTGPLGYNNKLATRFGQRVPDAKCFSLCGALGDNEDNLFSIGTTQTITIDTKFTFTTMSFFANDAFHFYWNNFGSIMIRVAKVKEKD